MIWNQLAVHVNHAVTEDLLKNWNCDANLESSTVQWVNAITEKNQQAPLFQLQNGKICTKLNDAKIASEFISVIQKTIELSGKEDCVVNYENKN